MEASKTNKYSQLTIRTSCRPVGRAANGDVRYCRTKVTKRGAVKVKVIGYPKVKVTVRIQARPKPGSRQELEAQIGKSSWIIRS